MTSTHAAARPAVPISPALFAVTVFASAGLVFMVQPMVGKLVLPLLGGSPSVWNTSIAFFQTALLVGYGYAHMLQRISSVRTQVLVHGAALVVAGLVLPLHVSGLFGEPSSTQPALWLLGVLAVSIGPPFAMLSATAPLVQAWHARVFRAEGGPEPYVLYAASNLGSLIALLAYPIAVEPTMTLQGQRYGWSLVYLLFVLLMAALGYLVSRAQVSEASGEVPEETAAQSVGWRRRLAWLGLAAIPSSLMLGVTTHLATDVASAPFLWVVPLALYLTTFIIAFSERPAIPPRLALLLQALTVAACAVLLPFKTANLLLQLVVHLAAFFFTALVCHQRLVSLRPAPARLTEFYFWMSLGGVVGGGFNAFVAPVIFTQVYEYPLVLALGALARPWGGRIGLWRWFVFTAGIAAAYAAGAGSVAEGLNTTIRVLLAAAAIAAVINHQRTLLFFALVVALSISSQVVGDRQDAQHSWRSFFGVLRETEYPVDGLGPVKILSHGTTMHGAQAQTAPYNCQPLTYYANETPIGQVFLKGRSKGPLTIGAVGLGTGAVSAYTRPGDSLTFFEIDPLVRRISTDPRNFSYVSNCAEGQIGFVIGDARLTLQKQPKERFDILLIDAFSSDAVPAHLLTVEAVRGYLDRLKPDGVLILHLSNRNLALGEPAAAVVKAAGGYGLAQTYYHDPNVPRLWAASVEAVIAGKTPEALAPFSADPAWRPADPNGVRPWTDDYTNLPGALYAHLKSRNDWLP
ncbi:MAG TPA: fused MFS/spermidine synthase [Phenylobacterium sp.]